MKILFLANRVPYPPHRGDKLKIYNLARRIQKSHTLYLIAFAESKEEMQYREKLLEIFDEVHFVHLPKWYSYIKTALNFIRPTPFQVAYFRRGYMHKMIDHFLKRHKVDAIHTQHMRMAQYTLHLKGMRRILDLPDAYSLYWQRRKQVDRPWYNRIFDYLESARVIRYERVVHNFDLNLACSVEDRDHLRKMHPEANIELLRNGVDLESFKYHGHDYSRANTLLFTGNMDYAPNVDAVVHFVENMLGEVHKRHPQVKLIIAGQRPVSAVKELASDKVIITGFVEDISDMYARADVVIAPLRFGAGTQNKVLEAMAMAVPVVCTDIGFKGLEIESGTGVIHTQNDTDFINEVVDLLSDAKKRETVGQKGLVAAREKFGWDGIAEQLVTYLKG